jgi:hypothetical protein
VDMNAYRTIDILITILHIQFLTKRSKMESKQTQGKLRVAITQHEPIWLDLEGTVDKTCKIIKEAAGAGAKLVTFPECWVSSCSLSFKGRHII